MVSLSALILFRWISSKHISLETNVKTYQIPSAENHLPEQLQALEVLKSDGMLQKNGVLEQAACAAGSIWF